MSASLKNSSVLQSVVPGKSHKDKERMFQVYLRGADSNRISPWQRAVLERLFDNAGLEAAIESGMKEYEVQLRGEEWDMFPDDAASIKRYGWAAHVVVLAVIIDDLEREVILSLGCGLDGNLAEHGIAIALKSGKWRFNVGDYLNDYKSRVERKEFEKQQSNVEPSSKNKIVVQKNPEFLFGTWEFDEKEARRVLGKNAWSKAEFDKQNKARKGYKIEVTALRVALTTQHGLMGEFKFAGSELRGDRVIIKFHHPKTQVGAETGVMEFTWSDDLLINQLGGLVLKKSNL
jgi:hypothetical protein